MGPDDEVKPLKGKMQVEVSPGQWHDVGYLSDLGATPSLTVEDESHQWNAGDLKTAAAMTTSIEVKAPGTELFKLIYGGTPSAKKLQPYTDQLGLYVQGVASQAAVPHHLIGLDGTKTSLWDYWAPPAQKAKEPVTLPATVALPTSVDDVPGEFPTVDIAGTPSAAKQQFIDQIGPCDGFELPLLSKEAAVKISKALKPGKVQIHMNVDTSSILASFAAMQKQINEAAKKTAQAVHDFAVAAAPGVDNMDRAEQLHRLIPGVDEVVKAPCACGATQRLWTLIQHLNDQHNPAINPADPWSRERIADWLETLDVDLRVQPPPTFEVGQRVHARISKAAGTVTAVEGNLVMVTMDRSGKVAEFRPTALVDGEPPDLHGYEVIGAGKVTDQLSIGDWVQDISAGHVGDIGQIISAKRGYDLNTDSNVIELKVRYASGPVVFLSPSQVEKVSALKPWKPMEPHLADGYHPNDFVEVVGAGFGHIKGYNPIGGPPGQAVFAVLLQSGEAIMAVPGAMKKAVEPDQQAYTGPTVDPYSPMSETQWTAEALDKLKKALELPKLSPGQIFAQLDIPMPPIGLADIVKHYLKPQIEGKVVQYQVDTNTEPPTAVFTVAWPDGTTSVCPREELILVEAYSPPTDEFIDWGGKKITAIHPNIY